ncbi:ABC transporter substrate-binding protein [Thorsellia anophelis]|uniref:sn-glycerol 3-phosphate transport system substrate-binding protein n=1 Tax=Thorsellia anophelis DSM 18579 TaxID=1123402 RepID=A0A1H9YP20_9GAMM|nr:ABC transporter substrate-binding protein [Thorsellia anophelis]SES70793.1 sn-glycerol 3-phosphate transport system substrate-binding protein [Thorsellia anophelis DSM 18579]
MLKKLIFSTLLLSSVSAVHAKTDIDFMFPVPVQGKLAQEMNLLTKQFNESQDDINVTPIFTGDYDSTKMKAAAAQKAGNSPSVVITAANNIHDLVISDSIYPMEEIIDTTGGSAEEFLTNEFWAALHSNAMVSGKAYAIPFHNSTPLLYYNKTLLNEAGLSVPQNWEEVIQVAKVLTNKEKNQWGIMLPTINTDYAAWILASLTYANGGQFYNPDYAGEVYYDAPSTIGALTFWRDLVYKYEVMPSGVLDNNAISSAFFEGRLGMAFLSTGALKFMKDNSKDFEMGVAFMPAQVTRGVPIGGASLVSYRGITDEQKKAAGVFINFLVSPENAARWSQATGYFAPRKSAYDLPEMKKFMQDNPEAKIALDQLQYAKGWYSMYDTVTVRRAIENRIQRLVNEPDYSPEQAAKDAQEEANKLLEPYVSKTALKKLDP